MAILRLARQLPHDTPHTLVDRIVVLGTEIGARVEEALNTPSRRRHFSSMSEARRHCGEITYWLRLLAADGAMPEDAIDPHLDEARALHGILTDICIQAKQRLDAEPDTD